MRTLPVLKNRIIVLGEQRTRTAFREASNPVEVRILRGWHYILALSPPSRLLDDHHLIHQSFLWVMDRESGCVGDW